MIDFLMAADFFERLCLTLLHSVWQVALLGLVASASCWLLCRKNVYWKYSINVATLIVALLAMPVTFVLLESKSPTANALPMSAGVTALKGSTSEPPIADVARGYPQATPIAIAREVKTESAAELESAVSMPVMATAPTPSDVEPSLWWAMLACWVTGIYLLGVAIMLARLLLSMFRANRLASRGKRITDGPAFETLQNLCSRWSLQVVPRLMQAEQIVVPKVVGLIRPAILLPASALTGLSRDQLEMILAHELAHIRRHDMWVNLIQRFAEAVLFFNPALWFLSRRISDLREYCCDEMACEFVQGNRADADEPRLRYAQALLRVVELKQESSSVGVETSAALAAIGHSPSEMRRRIARLFDEPLREPIRISRTRVCMLFVITALFCFGPKLWASVSSQSNVNPTEQQEPAEIAIEKSRVQSPETDAKGSRINNLTISCVA